MALLSKSQSRWQKTVVRILIALGGLYLLLLIPDSDPTSPASGNKQPFIWNRDEYWNALEARFQAARDSGCEKLAARIDAELRRGHELLAPLTHGTWTPENPGWEAIEQSFFELGPHVAACPQKLAAYVQLQTRLRQLVKTQSQAWKMNSPATRDRIYRLLYGGRAALEKVMLQVPSDSLPALSLGYEEPSQTPSTKILGVTIHSGDILVSRGGAPTSALIARGNDYPGNFSQRAFEK